MCDREGWLGTPTGQRARPEAVLQEIRLILLDCQRQLEQGTRHRVTRSQWAYLKAFDAYLRQPGRDTGGAMSHALTAVLKDAQVIPSERRQRQRGRTQRLGLRDAA